jgi:hypothetical protein
VFDPKVTLDIERECCLLVLNLVSSIPGHPQQVAEYVIGLSATIRAPGFCFVMDKGFSYQGTAQH